MQKKQVSGIGLIAIFSIFLIAMGVGTVTPAMASIIGAFPDVPIATVYMISTLPTLLLIPATLFAGTVAGKKVKYRTLAIAGVLCFIIGGSAPGLFYSNIYVILFFRALFGVGLGLMAPLGNALVLGLFEGQKQASYLGYGTLITNAGGVALQMAGGSLASIQWNYCFYGHLLAIVSLVLLFFLPEPQGAPVQAGTPEKPVVKEKMGKTIWVLAIIALLINLCNYPVMMNMSVLFAQKGAGDAAVSAVALSMFTVGGCVAGLIFGNLFRIFSRYLASIGLALMALAVYLLMIGQSAMVMTAGATLLGFSFSCAFPILFIVMGMKTPPSTIAIATSVVISLMNLGGFLSTYYLVALTSIFGENVYSALRIEIGLFAAMAVVLLFVNPFKAPVPVADPAATK